MVKMIKKFVAFFRRNTQASSAKQDEAKTSPPLLRGDHLMRDLTEEEEEAVMGGPRYPLNKYGYRSYHSKIPLFGIKKSRRNRNKWCCLPSHHWHW